MTVTEIGRAAVVAAAVLLALSGCAALRRQDAAGTEELLTAAGFQQRAASKPEQHQDLSAMPPYKLVARNNNGTTVYTFADPEHCHCLYVGGPKEFSEYQRLLTDREVAQELSGATLNWEAWGPWWW